MDGYVGVVKSFAGDYAPANWKFCDGSRLPIKGFEKLYAIIATRYGGDGTTYFNLPDVRGRTILGTGNGNDLAPRTLGEKGGAEKVWLTKNQLPQHTHAAAVGVSSIQAVASANLQSTVLVNDADGSQITPSGNYLGKDNSASGNYSNTKDGSSTLNENAISMAIEGNVEFIDSGSAMVVKDSGLSQGHENMSPFTVLNWIICVDGEFPQRPS
ncbi:phage tail protein [Gracilimonas mengyeensis]|uniref:Microcystin-dependent protein n=1 Tax=Gracilimonas mengyeensis TaxID=1302730 RepID=A0A521AUE6_9BACT|nr:tail fiber protein [Gracilimonas mengyeensis]SMO38424.1 Microcystin-dependent protein [Gracilimonas mengyeensis]